MRSVTDSVITAVTQIQAQHRQNMLQRSEEHISSDTEPKTDFLRLIMLLNLTGITLYCLHQGKYSYHDVKIAENVAKLVRRALFQKCCMLTLAFLLLRAATISQLINKSKGRSLF